MHKGNHIHHKNDTQYIERHSPNLLYRIIIIIIIQVLFWLDESRKLDNPFKVKERYHAITLLYIILN